MADIYLGLAIILFLSFGLLMLGLWAGRKLPRRWAIVCILLTLGFILFFGLVLLDGPLAARLLPFSNVIVLGNWLPLGTGLLAGLAWRQLSGRVWRRCLLLVPLGIIGLYKLQGPLLGGLPEMRDRSFWDREVCLQSSESSCSAAAAATLLRAHGIDAAEQEMAQLCLTREAGTTLHGIYRGLKLKTRGTPWEVQILPGSLDALKRTAGPVLLNVGLSRWTRGVDPRYERDWGWTPGVSHTVVLFGFLPENKLDMGDPAVGREQWFVDSLSVLWRGTAIRLVQR